MKIAGIISEYNPFHYGHKFHIEETKSLYGATHIVAVMSGNFVQRGDVAIFDKYSRAKTALENGADLVLALPTPCALSSADYFARSAVHILDSLGCIDMLSFGSECGDIEVLKQSVAAVQTVLEGGKISALAKQGLSFPSALRRAVAEESFSAAEVLDSPNNTLALEYIKALNRLGSGVVPVTVTRKGAPHDSEFHNDKTEFLSASQLRKMIEHGENITKFSPSKSGQKADIRRLETAIFAALRTADETELSEFAGMLSGMPSRIFTAARKASTLDELFFAVKTRCYTLASVRRAVLSVFLDIRKQDQKALPAYIQILGMNEKGREVLAAAKPTLPVNTSLKALSDKSALAKKQAKTEERAGNLYALAFEPYRPCGLDFTSKPIIL